MTEQTGGSLGPSTDRCNEPKVEPVATSNVRPLLTLNDERDLTRGNTELPPEALIRGAAKCVETADIQYLGGSQFGPGVTLAPSSTFGMKPLAVSITSRQGFGMETRSVPISRSSTALTRTVASIVELRSEKQMCRIDARRVVAVMEDKQTFRDRAVGEYPGEAVRAYGLAVDREAPISVARASRPHPARPKARLVARDGTIPIHLGPEARRRIGRTGRSAMSQLTLVVHSAQTSCYGRFRAALYRTNHAEDIIQMSVQARVDGTVP